MGGINTCCDCGQFPWVIKEPDGYWYVGCTIQCGCESEWDTQKSVAIDKWNETQQIKKLRQIDEATHGQD